MPEMPCPYVQYNGHMLVLQGGPDTKEYRSGSTMNRISIVFLSPRSIGGPHSGKSINNKYPIPFLSVLELKKCVTELKQPWKK